MKALLNDILDIFIDLKGVASIEQELDSTLDGEELYYLIWFIYDFIEYNWEQKQAGLRSKCTDYKSKKWQGSTLLRNSPMQANS